MEWVAYNRAYGMRDIIIVSNNCIDGSDLLLDALLADPKAAAAPAACRASAFARLAEAAGEGHLQWQALTRTRDQVVRS